MSRLASINIIIYIPNFSGGTTVSLIYQRKNIFLFGFLKSWETIYYKGSTLFDKSNRNDAEFLPDFLIVK